MYRPNGRHNTAKSSGAEPQTPASAGTTHPTAPYIGILDEMVMCCGLVTNLINYQNFAGSWW